MNDETIRVEVLYAESGRAWRIPLTIPPGTTAGALLDRLPALAKAWPAAAFAPVAMAVFGREIDAGQVLRDGDRFELLRALPVDPKLARRVRAEAMKPN